MRAETVLCGDHPRVRGENVEGQPVEGFGPGSPPRARGEPYGILKRTTIGRITPACAGRTSETHPPNLPTWDHPRVRGENL